MKVNTYTGIAALKEAYAVASNGMLKLTNAAFTVSQTSTNHNNASVIFVMAANLELHEQLRLHPEGCHGQRVD